MLSTFTPGAGGELVEHHHPDRLGTRLVTRPSDGTSFEQAHLPFGNGVPSESLNSTNRRFTSYDRSGGTGLDYAVNRRYDPMQGRFTQVDPIGARASSLVNPQTLNLYAYCVNDPVNHVDPDGLFIGRLFRAIGRVFAKAIKWVAFAAAIAVAVVAVITVGAVPLLTTIQLLLSSASTIANTLGYRRLGLALGIAAGALGIYNMKPGVIRNLSEAGSGAERLAALAAGVGAIGNFISQALPQNSAPSLPDAINAARKALEKNQACRDLFSKGNGLELLNKLDKKGKIKISDAKVPKYLSPTGRLKDNPKLGGIAQGDKVYLNPSSSLVTGTMKGNAPIFGPHPPNDRLAILILHEVLHVSNDFPAESGQFATEDSLLNSATVETACFPGA